MVRNVADDNLESESRKPIGSRTHILYFVLEFTPFALSPFKMGKNGLGLFAKDVINLQKNRIDVKLLHNPYFELTLN